MRFFTLAIFSLNFLFFAQLKGFGQEHTCGFDDIHQERLKNDPVYFKKVQEFEKFVEGKRMRGFQRAAGDIYTIPVVVHVIHLGEAVGTGTNISDAQIQSAITNMTDVYRNNTGTSLVDTEIQFALATSDPNCAATNGIVRVDGSGVAGYAADGVFLSTVGAVENDVKDLSKWPADSYFNVWIVSEIDGGSGGGVQGWANFPFPGDPYNGTVILFNAFGYDPGQILGYNLKTFTDENGTAVHEGGHWLSCYHTFQGDCAGVCCPPDVTIGTDSDGCVDTPPHMRSNSDCQLGINNTCAAGDLDLVIKNYMDYSSCPSEFTNDQKTRMRAALEGPRIGIINSKGLDAPAAYSPPVAASCTPVTNPAVGMTASFCGVLSVVFNDLASTSGYANTDGGYLDNTGSCLLWADVEQGQTYNLDIEVGVNPNQLLAWIDYNNDGDFLDAGEEIVNDPAVPASSTLSTPITIPGTSVTGTSLRMRILVDLGAITNCAGGTRDPNWGQAEDYTVIISAPVVTPVELSEFSGINKVYGNLLNWKTGSELNSEYFAVERSEDGENFYEIGKVKAAGFSSSFEYYDFVDEDFKNKLSYYRLRQVDINGGYKIYPAITIVSPEQVSRNVKIYPNPSNGEIKIGNLPTGEQVEIKLTNAVGKLVNVLHFKSNGSGELPFNISGYPNGIYFIRIKSNGVDEIQKLIKN